MIEPVNNYTAVLDACVLAPMPICHTLLNLAEEPALYVPKWSEEILNEVSRTLKKWSYSDDQIKRRVDAMRAAFEDAIVTGYEDLVPVMKNDEKDRHVLAAAVRCGAHVIITHNLKDFPEDSLKPYGIALSTPDEFLCHQYHLEPEITLAAIERQASDRKSTVAALLGKLTLSVPEFVRLIEANWDCAKGC